MKAISSIQPMAWALFYAGKDIENRTWWTWFRGDVLIHTSSKKEEKIYGEFIENLGFKVPKAEDLDYGKIIGMVFWGGAAGTDCKSPWWFKHDYGYQVGKPRLLKEPIPMKGRQRFFETGLQMKDLEFV